MTAGRMEIDCTYPILVSLTGHDILLVLEVPNLPGAIITSRCDYLFLSVKCHASDSPGVTATMSINFLVLWHSLHEIVEGLWEIGVWSGILRPWSVLAFEWHVFIYSATHSLLLHAGVNLSLDLLLMFVNWFLNISYLLL
jgi:hypothetical protein